MAFPVTANVPPMYRWEGLANSFHENLKLNQVISTGDDLLDHYAWLLQITSWKYGIDWDPKHGVVSMEIPFSGNLLALDTAKDRVNYEQSFLRDEICALFDLCLEQTSLKRLLAHFQEAN